MASVFKRGGRKNRYGKYQAQYIDENGKQVVETTGTTDYDDAWQIATKWESDAALRRTGVIDASQARYAEQNLRPLSEHVADYFAHCEHIGQDDTHVANKRTQLDKLIEGIGASRLADLDPNKVETYLSSLVKAGKSHRTHNQHRATVVSAEWCCEQGRLAANPLKIVPTLNEAKDKRRVRRALTADELSKLIGISDARRPYYLFAYYTGLRVKAVKAAVWGDVDFDAATIRVRVGNAKGKKDDVYVPLHSKLIDELAAIKPAFAQADTPIFPVVVSLKTFHKDCTRAKIDRYDAEGRQLDRHALRTTLGTHLAKAGVSPQQAMKVLGHTDVRITMKHYTDLRISDTAKAVQALPSIEPQQKQTEPQAMAATGTDGKPADAAKTPVPSAQQKRQQSCGPNGQTQSPSGNIIGATQRTNEENPMRTSPGKTSSFRIVGQRETRTDLMPSANAANMLETRAVGAVG